MKKYEKLKKELEDYFNRNGFINPKNGWKLKNNKKNKELIEKIVDWNFKFEDLKNEEIKKEKEKELKNMLKTYYGYYRINANYLWDFLIDLEL